jgi:formylglycine-generating enzyme required for sulfatase activity
MALEAGSNLGPYQILTPLGAGGMGEVYRARDSRLEREVAVKVLSERLAGNADALARFEREAKAVAALSHPNILAIHDFGRDERVVFAVTELLEGETLRSRLSQGALPWRKAIEIGVEIARGLAAAHEKGVIHRDIKPENVFLTTDGRVKILDFGLARVDQRVLSAPTAETQSFQDAQTEIGAVLGTVGYMSPEQVRGQAVDARSDIFSLGCVLHEMVVGRKTFVRDTAADTMAAILNVEPPQLTDIDASVPAELSRAIQHCLEKNAAARFHSAHDLAFALRAVSTHFVTSPFRGVRGWMCAACALIAAALGVTAYVLTKDRNPHIADTLKPVFAPQPGWHGWPSEAPAPAVAPFDAAQAKQHQQSWADYLGVPVEYTNSIGMKFRLIPPGEFLMGMSVEELEAFLQAAPADNLPVLQAARSMGPQHKVILTRPVYLGVHEVTQAQYERVMGNNPSHFFAEGEGKDKVAGIDTSNHPVEMTSWNDATQFCLRLSVQEQRKPFYAFSDETVTHLNGTGYRLPTEAEWEFACRAGTTTKYWSGDTEADLQRAGWYLKNSGGRAHAVGELAANPFGLFDVHQNVWEWCQDRWDSEYYSRFQDQPAIDPECGAGEYRVRRGSFWDSPLIYCDSAHRFFTRPETRMSRIGFRIVLRVDAARMDLNRGAVPAPNAKPRSPDADRSPPPSAKAPFDPQQAERHQQAWANHLGVPVEYTNSIGMKLRLIPPGEFLMGSPVDRVQTAIEVGNDLKLPKLYLDLIRSESPQHRVTIRQPLLVGKTEVTIADFRKFVEAVGYVTDAEKLGGGFRDGSGYDPAALWNTPGYSVTDNSPVTQITWNDCVAFCNWLSEQEKLEAAYRQDDELGWLLVPGTDGYRLPTEAEWEYACRAGTITNYSFGDNALELDEHAWYLENSGGSIRAVGLKPPN